jgi:hypothetical protein
LPRRAFLRQKHGVKFPLFIAFCLIAGGALKAQPALVPPVPTLGEGAHFDELHVGKRVYRDVKVREVTVRSILISDTDGIASIPLRELPPDLQRAFGYQPALEAAADNRIHAAAQQAELNANAVREQAKAQASKTTLATKFESLTNAFQHNTPEIESEVDLRPRFREFGLKIKDQGRRPSCVIFAVVSAVEFENAEIAGEPERLSEDYVIWATCQILKRAPQLIGQDQRAENVEDDDRDMGFSFRSVLESLRVFGLATQAEMPDSFVRYGNITPPSAELIREAAQRRKLVVHRIPGANNTARIANIIHVLNRGIPVPIAVLWPSNRLVRNGFLNTQSPLQGDGHAITLVGYKCSSGNLEDTEFIFRNSYGPSWGEGGYGRVSFQYLSANLQSAVALEVQRPDQTSSDMIAARGN